MVWISIGKSNCPLMKRLIPRSLILTRTDSWILQSQIVPTGPPRCLLVYLLGFAEGFSAQHRTELPTLGASGVVASDLNGDGYLDLLFANSTMVQPSTFHLTFIGEARTALASIRALNFKVLAPAAPMQETWTMMAKRTLSS